MMSKRKDLQEWQEESNKIHNYEFDILEEAINCHTKVNVLHRKCGNILSTTMTNHIRRYCKHCSNKAMYSHEEYQLKSDQIHNSEYTIIDSPSNVKVNVNVLHKKCGRLSQTTMNNHINHQNKCQICSKYARKNNEYWVKKVKEIWGDEFILLEDVDNVHNKINVHHQLCGNILSKSMDNLTHAKRGCPICTTTEYGVIYIEKYLDDNNIKYEREKSFINMINPLTNRKLRLDFYLPEHNIAIEVDGLQHHIPIKHWGGEEEYKKSVYRDSLKETYLKENNIKLIRINNKKINKINILLWEH